MARNYLRLVNPFGQTGFTAVTFLTVFPLTQVMVVVFFTDPVAAGVVVFWLASVALVDPVAEGPEEFWFALAAAEFAL